MEPESEAGRGRASTPLQAPGKIGEKGSSRVSLLLLLLLLLRRRHRPKRKREREIHFPTSIPFSPSPPTSFLGGECKEEEEVERNGVKAEEGKQRRGWVLDVLSIHTKKWLEGPQNGRKEDNFCFFCGHSKGARIFYFIATIHFPRKLPRFVV